MQKLNFQKVKNLKAALGLPNMTMTLNNWEQPITLIKVLQDIVKGDLVTTQQELKFQGVVQPLSAERLQLLPEGQRSWEHLLIHVKSGVLDLQTADKVLYNKKRFKIMAVKDYAAYGFCEYELIRDFESNPIVE